jgi:undecaprenyl-diphosphatase
MTALQALVLAIVQGVTELFPVSSLGHVVILPSILRWPVDQNAPGFLPFLVVMHLGTAIALLLHFWRIWFEFATALLIRRGPKAVAERRLLLKVVVATIPAVIIGGLLEHLLRKGFGAPRLAAAFLIVNGVLLFAAERPRRQGHVPLAGLRWRDALIIGVWQRLALVPGLSRSGATWSAAISAGSITRTRPASPSSPPPRSSSAATVLEAPMLLKTGSAYGDLPAWSRSCRPRS